MPIDFQSYLLSSSPPGFELDTCLSENFYEQNGFNRCAKTLTRTKTIHCLPEQPTSLFCTSEFSPSPNSKNAERILSWQQSYENASSICEIESVPRRCKTEAILEKKRVSFADDMGLALEDVRFMTEPSDMPPSLQPDVLARLNLGSSSFAVEPVSYMLNFPQPISDYLALRNKVENSKVSLESATVRESSIIGTVRVKNIAFEKKVFIRRTYDGWDTYEDILSTYVPATGSSAPPTYETFKFEFSLPSRSTGDKNVYFAVCYQTGTEQFWDNKNGENYEIISVMQDAGNINPAFPGQAVFSLHHKDSWTDFSGWDGIESHDPYW